jgi:hypothetical protein
VASASTSDERLATRSRTRTTHLHSQRDADASRCWSCLARHSTSKVHLCLASHRTHCAWRDSACCRLALPEATEACHDAPAQRGPLGRRRTHLSRSLASTPPCTCASHPREPHCDSAVQLLPGAVTFVLAPHAACRGSSPAASKQFLDKLNIALLYSRATTIASPQLPGEERREAGRLSGHTQVRTALVAGRSRMRGDRRRCRRCRRCRIRRPGPTSAGSWRRATSGIPRASSAAFAGRATPPPHESSSSANGAPLFPAFSSPGGSSSVSAAKLGSTPGRATARRD